MKKINVYIIYIFDMPYIFAVYDMYVELLCLLRLFVCLFACLLVCSFVCLFVCFRCVTSSSTCVGLVKFQENSCKL